MADGIDEAEWKRREYELKRHQMLIGLYETEFERQFKLASLAVAGNLAGLFALWTGLKDHKGPVEHIPIWAFSGGALLAVFCLSSLFITAGAMKTIWRFAAARHFNPPADSLVAGEERLRKVQWATNKAADSFLNWSGVLFLIGCWYTFSILSSLLPSQ